MKNITDIMISAIDMMDEREGPLQAVRYLKFLNNLTFENKVKQILFDAVMEKDFKSAKDILDNNIVALKQAEDFGFGAPEGENVPYTLADYAAQDVKDSGDFETYKFLRKNGYSMDDLVDRHYNLDNGVTFRYTKNDTLMNVETEVLNVDKQSLLWQASRKVKREDAGLIDHIDDLKEVLNSAKHFKHK